MSSPKSMADILCDHPIAVLCQAFIWAFLCGSKSKLANSGQQQQKLISRNRRLERRVHGLDDRLSHQFRLCYAQLPPFPSIPRGATEVVFSSRWAGSTDDRRKGDEFEICRDFESFALVSYFHHRYLFFVVSIWTNPYRRGGCRIGEAGIRRCGARYEDNLKSSNMGPVRLVESSDRVCRINLCTLRTTPNSYWFLSDLILVLCHSPYLLSWERTTVHDDPDGHFPIITQPLLGDSQDLRSWQCSQR